MQHQLLDFFKKKDFLYLNNVFHILLVWHSTTNIIQLMRRMSGNDVSSKILVTGEKIADLVLYALCAITFFNFSKCLYCCGTEQEIRKIIEDFYQQDLRKRQFVNYYVQNILPTKHKNFLLIKEM